MKRKRTYFRTVNPKERRIRANQKAYRAKQITEANFRYAYHQLRLAYLKPERSRS